MQAQNTLELFFQQINSAGVNRINDMTATIEERYPDIHVMLSNLDSTSLLLEISHNNRHIIEYCQHQLDDMISKMSENHECSGGYDFAVRTIQEAGH